LYAIGEAIVHKGLNDDFLDPSDLSIILYDDINMNTIVFRHYGASPDDVTHVTIPIGTVASRVRVVQLGEDRSILSLSEVVVSTRTYRWSDP